MPRLPEKPPIIELSIVPDLLEQYLTDPAFSRQITEYNAKYCYWDELKYRIPDDDLRIKIWTVMKLFRTAKYERVSTPKLNLNYSMLPRFYKSLHDSDTYLSGYIQISRKKLKLEKKYIVNSLMEEAIASSILEGAVTTRKQARQMLEQKRKPRNHSEQMVLNNYETMQMILDNKDEQLTPGLLLQIQKTVTQDTLPERDVGRFRDTNDVVVVSPSDNTVYHVPPDFHEIGPYIEALCTFVNKEGNDPDQFIHPIVKGIILHFLIGYIHPFNDGNGRTARSLFYWYALSRGYWLVEYLSISRNILRSKKKYALAYLYSEYDGMDITYFIKYNLQCIDESMNDLIQYIGDQQGLQVRATEIIKERKDLNFRQAEILTEMMENKNQYFTINQIKQKYHVVYQTARSDLFHLERLGYISGIKRNRTYYFSVTDKNRGNMSRE